MSEQAKAAVAWLVWIDDTELLQRRPQVPADLIDPPHYEADLVYADDKPSGGLGGRIMFSSLDEGLAWARAVAEAVVVRPSWNPLVHYTATVGPPETWPRRD